MAKYIRVPEALHEAVKDVAYKRRTHMESIAEDALRMYLGEPVICRSCGNVANLTGDLPAILDKSPAREENTRNSELLSVLQKLDERIGALESKQQHRRKTRRAGGKS